tara:strand:+ start:181 stop:441 length:261 start_codon:yes stop_codon:yes gene_type:complete
MELTREEIVHVLSEDYGKRAKILNVKFQDAYDKYVQRCSIRTYENLLHQFIVGKLDKPIKAQPKLRNDEYIISASDDDCEDGVCKL